jgi:hypothetical protein
LGGLISEMDSKKTMRPPKKQQRAARRAREIIKEDAAAGGFGRVGSVKAGRGEMWPATMVEWYGRMDADAVSSRWAGRRVDSAVVCAAARQKYCDALQCHAPGAYF